MKTFLKMFFCSNNSFRADEESVRISIRCLRRPGTVGRRRRRRRRSQQRRRRRRAVEDHLGRVALELKDLIGKRIPVAAGALPLDKVKFPAH